MRAGQDMVAARAQAVANRRTRLVVRLLNDAPPLWERHRYAIAQALAEITAVDVSDAPRTESTGGVAMPLAGGSADPTAHAAVREAWERYQTERVAAGLRPSVYPGPLVKAKP